MNANQSTTMYESVPVVSELNKVTGFDPLKFIRRTNKGEKKLDLKYKKLWFRLKYPNGRIKLSALKITDQLAIIEARVYFEIRSRKPALSHRGTLNSHREACISSQHSMLLLIRLYRTQALECSLLLPLRQMKMRLQWKHRL